MRARHAFSLVELLVAAGSVAILVSIGVPTSSRARELAKRRVCNVNLKGIGIAARLYALSNDESWMVPPFKANSINREGIDYLDDDGTTTDWPDADDNGEVGNQREFESRSATTNFPDVGSTAVSTTRSFWMLVRSGDISVKQFVCPSSLDTPDATEQLDLYYDFTGYSHISYGYQVPFGPVQTRARLGADSRQVFAADKGPWYLTPTITWDIGTGAVVTLSDPPSAWRRFNSANHGGRSNGEGQNCLFGDGSVSFQRIPAVGVDHDNIYTLIDNAAWGTIEHIAVIHGLSPHLSPPPYPGQDAYGIGPNRFASTDSLIYP